MELKENFKQTDIGIVPVDWDVTQVKTVADIKTGPFGSSLHERDYVQDGTPIITVEHLGEFGVVHSDLPKVSESDRQRLLMFSLRKGDIVFSRVGSVDRNSMISEKENGWLFSGRLLRIRIRNKLTHPPFLSYYFHSDPFKRRVRNVAVGQTMPSLNTQIISDIDIVLPPPPEQRAIAAALSDVDALITSLDRLIAKKRLIKQAAMQQLLTGKTRLPGFSGEWTVKRLGELGYTYGGITGKIKADFGHGSAKYISFLNVLNNVVIDLYQLEIVNICSHENQNHAVKGDLFFNSSSETPEEVGMCAVLLHDVEDVYLNSFCFGFRLNPDVPADGLYLAYFFRSGAGRKLLYALAQGATRHNLSKTALMALEFGLPTQDEQRAIATVLSDIDAEIAELEKRRGKTRLLKQGMMQELLTGRIRLCHVK